MYASSPSTCYVRELDVQEGRESCVTRSGWNLDMLVGGATAVSILSGLLVRFAGSYRWWIGWRGNYTGVFLVEDHILRSYRLGRKIGT